MPSGNGIILSAFGEKYLDLAFQAAESIRRNSPGLEVDLFAEADVAPGPFSQVHLLQDVWVRSKLDAMIRSRFDKTLFLDVDLLVIADLGDIFDVLDRFDLAITHDQNRNSPLGRAEYRKPFSNAFPQFNAGVVGFRRSQAMQDFLETWKWATKDHGVGKDQPSLRELLWESDLRVTVLPPEYNFCNLSLLDRMVPKFHTAPRIIHSTLFLHKSLPLPGEDALSHYIGRGRACKARLMLAADHTLARRTGGQVVLPTWHQSLQQRTLSLLDGVGRVVGRWLRR